MKQGSTGCSFFIWVGPVCQHFSSYYKCGHRMYRRVAQISSFLYSCSVTVSWLLVIIIRLDPSENKIVQAPHQVINYSCAVKLSVYILLCS